MTLNQDDIIRMFNEAGKSAGWKPGLGNALVINYLTHFAALVAASRDAVHQEAMRWDVHSCGPTCKRYACVAMREAVVAEQERICAAIKAEDDYCVDNGDYMLDSDDCIAVAKGEWTRPDFSIRVTPKGLA
jgi:hypothetical protein